MEHAKQICGKYITSVTVHTFTVFGVVLRTITTYACLLGITISTWQVKLCIQYIYSY